MVSPHPRARNLRHGRYSRPGTFYFLTTSVAGARRPFERGDHALIVLDAIAWLHRSRRLRTDAAVIMPDHVHIAGRLGDTSLSRVMHTLKSYSAHRLVEAGVEAPVWQPGYYDHALRDDEDYRVKVRYLVENPLRAGLVERIEDYPYLMAPDWH